jgi:hypothetical protein
VAMESEPGPPMTLGNAAKSQAAVDRLSPEVRHQVVPDPFQLAQRRGPDTLVLDWRERRVCFLVRRPGGGFRGERDRGARGVLITWACAPSRYARALCGRARLSSDVSEIKLVFSIPPHRPTPNIAPS